MIRIKFYQKDECELNDGATKEGSICADFIFDIYGASIHELPMLP